MFELTKEFLENLKNAISFEPQLAPSGANIQMQKSCAFCSNACSDGCANNCKGACRGSCDGSCTRSCKGHSR